VSKAEELKLCGLPEACQGTRYVEPEYMQEQEARLQKENEQKMTAAQCKCREDQIARFQKKWGTCYKPPPPCCCPSGNCGCD
jgi:hypothetical protein